MPYIPCQFSRPDYLEHAQLFEDVKIDDAENELCEFNNDAEDLAFELAYMRYRVAKLEQFIRNGVELGYIAVPDCSDPALDTINEILGVQPKGMKCPSCGKRCAILKFGICFKCYRKKHGSC